MSLPRRLGAQTLGAQTLGALALGALLALGGGCADDLTPVVGTTIRVGKPKVEPGTELELKIFTNEGECLNAVDTSLVSDCVPHVDRASGEVRLGIQYRLDTDVFYMPMAADNLRVIHQGTEIQDGQNGQRYTLIPHEPRPTTQLYILVIDGSSSMFEDNRMEKVRQALLMPEVKEAFFPENVRTGVAIFTFTDSKPEPLGGTLQVIDNVQDYTKLIKRELRVLSGYTHLYEAVTYATGELLQNEAVRRFIDLEQAAPTVIALTDGFNNLGRADLCSTNAPRLTALLRHLAKVRSSEEGDIRKRPQVFTVGLGRPLRKSFKLPDTTTSGLEVTPAQLCGKFVNRQIDGDLERYGIDNASMAWIADVGGGFDFVKNSKEGLGEAFRAAAAKRYTWFEVRYRVDPFYLRRAFRARMRLLTFASAESSVMVYPSAWLDAPPGVEAEDGWHRPRTYLHTATVAIPALGLVLAMTYLSAALFNTRRALFRRGRSRTGGGSPSGTPPQAPGS